MPAGRCGDSPSKANYTSIDILWGDCPAREIVPLSKFGTGCKACAVVFSIPIPLEKEAPTLPSVRHHLLQKSLRASSIPDLKCFARRPFCAPQLHQQSPQKRFHQLLCRRAARIHQLMLQDHPDICSYVNPGLSR